MQSRKELRDLKRTLTKVRKSEEKIKNLSDEELSALTEQFKSRYSDGESLESLMPEAFAAICEADYRVLGKRPYDVQILAAAALHGGYLAEMNTGEGKTLSATMPLYLNALTGKSCMLVTTNEYLASRDGAEMGEVYNFMGLSCSYPDADDTKKQDDDEKRQFYSADIIYTTNGTLGFDFLFDNLVKKKEDRFLCDFHYVIIDEADSVLLDSAIMPLVISGVPRVQSNLYDVCDFFVTTLVEDIDYIEEDKAVWLTPKGVKFAESFFGISNFYGKENFEINRHVTLSLRAHKLLKNKKDYVVTDKKEVELFDGATGRLMHGVKLRGGQHQAIEAKEKVEISQEYRTVASVTFQNLFMMFDKMAGMSGTLMDAKDELFETYGKQVVRAVEVTHTADGITLLFDTFSGESKNLLESFKNAGAAFHAAVIEDDGFLPDDVMSVYGFFLGDYRKADSLPGKPLYFNQIQIPDYWRIEGDNSSAKVMDRTRERARIFFTEPTHRRQVKIVDWLDDAGQVRLSEHYNRYGAIFCHTVFNKKGQKALRKFFDVTGREMIVENFVTGDILVRWQDKDWIFRSKTDFIAFFIRCAGLEDTAVYFNSLSYPFFASQALAPNGFRDALFWHEPVGDEIPGNMQIILHDQGTRAKRVFVSRRESYDRLIALGAPSDKVKQLGYIYSFVRENKHRPHILVCTNSENVGHLTELASLMPQMHFHVAAITEMSSKLMSAGQYDNVSLYPNVKMSVLDSLFEKCDFYLDINHEGEIVDAVHRAFLNNMLIVGYEETMHNAYYTADTNTFKESEYADMAEALNLTLAMPHLIDEALAMQKKAAVAADATDYMEILHL